MPTVRRRSASRAVAKITLADGEQILVGRKPRLRISGLIKKDDTDKKLKAFQKVVGMWAEKDTSFFDDK